jgi:hypothetical protein
VTWLSEDPITGTLNADDLQLIDVTFDSTVPGVTEPGDYLAFLNVQSEDPINNRISIPVTMTINVPVTYGQIAGTVTSQGYCEVNPSPLVDAEVVIVSATRTLTLTTDAMGFYSYWLDESEAPLAVYVTMDGYREGMATGLPLVAGDTTTQDFDLRLLEPCVSVDPTSLEITLLTGYSETIPLDLTNGGAFETPFEIEESNGAPVDIPWLSTDPITGTLASDSMQTIDVTFDTMTYTVGTYTATLKVNSDDPISGTIEVPVTMHIEDITYGVEVSVDSSNLSAEPGTVVTYTLSMTNTGNVMDSYDIAVGVHDWDMDMPTSMPPMMPDESHSMEVMVAIPYYALDGDTDSVTIIISSQSDPTKMAMITLTTQAIMTEYQIYLPILLK